MTIYQKLLYELITKNVVSKVALRALAPDRRRIDRAIEKAKSNGHVKEFSHIFRQGDKRLTVDCLRITTEGLNYVRATAKDVIPWSKYLSVPAKGKLAVTGSGLTRKDMANRYAKMSLAAVMADCVGAAENLLFCSDYAKAARDGHRKPQTAGGVKTPCVDELSSPGDKRMLSDMVRQARARYEQTGRRQFQNGFAPKSAQSDSDDMTFIDALTIKRSIAENEACRIDWADLSGRYCGVLDSHFQTVLMYAVDRMHPLVWYTRLEKKDLEAFTKAKKRLHPEGRGQEENNAVLLVPDARAFKETYDAAETRRVDFQRFMAKREKFKPYKKPGVSPLGDNFDHFWVIPVTYQGARDLEEIMTLDPKADERELIPAIPRTMRYAPNVDELDKRLFPLRDRDGTFVSVCPHMDIKIMWKLDMLIGRYRREDESMKFAVICFEWQSPYWKAILPDVEIRYFEDETYGMGLKRLQASSKPGNEKFWIEKTAEEDRMFWMPSEEDPALDFPDDSD